MKRIQRQLAVIIDGNMVMHEHEKIPQKEAHTAVLVEAPWPRESCVESEVVMLNIHQMTLTAGAEFSFMR